MKNSTWPGGSGERRRSLKTAAGKSRQLMYHISTQFIVAELIETSGWEAIKEQKKRITPRYVMLAVNHDKEMLALLPQGKVIIAQAGVVPHIHSVLLPTPRPQIVDEPELCV
ncbi:hypothetical protein DFP72DRAFT_903053 [Ephemerocybe angulata]|uniref:Histone H2A n=1 Tax=Ephemerocybe angulata TaxID=980116 RepID=A0A8H6HV72_9AGAR|nr:hypothetical protein DFP72DRAFT_903053 [Tulosesus angulatus]